MAILIIFLGLLMFIVPIAIIVLIVQAIAKRNKTKKDFDNIMRSVYIYSILIITLIVIITGAISAFSVGLDVLLPEKDVSGSLYNNQERELNINIVNLLTDIAAVVTCLPIFIYHNKLAKKDRNVKTKDNV